MHMRRALSVMSPLLFFVGCDLMSAAFNNGYDSGYGCVDAVYGCIEADRERRQEEAERTQVWEDACNVAVEPLFSTDAELSSADSSCSTNYGSQSQLIVCSDDGQEAGAEPPGCDPYQRPVAGITIDGDYSCPSPVPNSYKCLCCEGLDTGRSDCNLIGGWCFDDANCCSGTCVFESETLPDGGIVNETRGECL
jgi:hypothetical protein